MTAVWFVLGLGAMVGGAELLVRGAARLALTLGISPLVVGLTVVAFGTSAPEMAVSVQSSLAGRVDIAVGNVVGSNIFNVLLILGLSAVAAPLLVHQQVVRRETPLLVAVTMLLWWMAADGALGRAEGALLTALVVLYTGYLVWESRRESRDVRKEYEDALARPPRPDWRHGWTFQILLVVAGLALLVLGSRWMVDAAVEFARLLGVSELVIALTIVAGGTSLPELATSVLAALRGERDIAVGNVVGSNIFNILAVTGVAASLAPVPLTVAPAALAFDVPVMVASALLCLPVFFTGGRVSRGEGLLFLGYYLAYSTYLVLDAADHDAIHAFSLALSVILPLTVIALVIHSIRYWMRH